MRNRALWVVFAVLLIAGAGGWYFLSPGYAMSQLADAARGGKEDELRERIDFPRVRDALKTELRARLAAEFSSDKSDGMGKLGAALGMAMIDPMVEGFVTPESIGSMVRNGKMKRPGDEQPEGKAAPSAADADWTVEREGFSKFRAKPQGEGIENPPALLFERDGFGWKLVEIELPAAK